MKNNIFLLIILISFGCTKVVPRKPINPKPSTTLLKATAKQTKSLNDIEDKKIEHLIVKDSLSKYFVSQNGFWYKYIIKKEQDLPRPKIGNEVSFEYEITDLNDQIIYNKEELGIKKYKIDKEDFISAIQKGIKLMKVGETITFVIPSYSAFGITGDGNRIGINQSIKSTITLLNIK